MHPHTHTHLLSKLPPKYQHIHTTTPAVFSTEFALNDSACVCLSACLHRQSPAHPPSLLLFVSHPPPSLLLLLFITTQHPIGSPFTRLPPQPRAGRVHQGAMREKGTYGLVRRLLHDDGSSAGKHYPPSTSSIPPLPALQSVSSSSSPLSKHLDAVTGSLRVTQHQELTDYD